jgi:hypothetical protein
MTNVTRIISLAAALAAVSARLSAQNVGAPVQGRYGLALDAMRPQPRFFENYENNGATLFLSAHAELKSGVRVHADVPFAFSKEKQLGVSQTSSTIGNPYLGIELQRQWLTVDLGARAPLASKDEVAAALGMITDLDRMEAFIPDMAAVTAVARAEVVSASGFGVAGFGGPDLLLYTGAETDVENELLVIYGVEVSYRSNIVHTGARLSARMITTEPGSFNERSVHQLGLFANVGHGVVRPTLQFRIPIDNDLRDQAKWSGGVGLQIELGKR